MIRTLVLSTCFQFLECGPHIWIEVHFFGRLSLSRLGHALREGLYLTHGESLRNDLLGHLTL